MVAVRCYTEPKDYLLVHEAVSRVLYLFVIKTGKFVEKSSCLSQKHF